MVDLNEGMEQEPLPELSQEDAEMFGLVPPSYSFTLVHERVFVTWYEHRQEGDGDDYQFIAEPKAIELPEHQAQQVHDLLNHQNDKLQSLLQTFVEGDGTPDCEDPDAERMVGNTGHLDV